MKNTLVNLNTQEFRSYSEGTRIVLWMTTHVFSPLPGEMQQSSPELVTRQHIRQRIVDTVEEEHVSQKRRHLVHEHATGLQSHAPVERDRVDGDGESAQPEGQYVHRHGQSGASLQTVEFGTSGHPRE